MSVGQLRLYDGTILPLRHDDPPVKLGRAHISVTGKPALAVGRLQCQVQLQTAAQLQASVTSLGTLSPTLIRKLTAEGTLADKLLRTGESGVLCLGDHIALRHTAPDECIVFEAAQAPSQPAGLHHTSPWPQEHAEAPPAKRARLSGAAGATAAAVDGAPATTPAAGRGDGTGTAKRLVVLILCGPPGSGKSTFCQQLAAKSKMTWVRVNQDSAGRNGKKGTRAQCIAAATAALARGCHVAVDRCHVDAVQRQDFVQLAHTVQAEAHAVVLKLPKELCAARAEARKDHEGGVEGPRAKPLVFQMVARADKAGLPSLAEGLASVMVCHSDQDVKRALDAWAAYGSSPSHPTAAWKASQPSLLQPWSGQQPQQQQKQAQQPMHKLPPQTAQTQQGQQPAAVAKRPDIGKLPAADRVLVKPAMPPATAPAAQHSPGSHGRGNLQGPASRQAGTAHAAGPQQWPTASRQVPTSSTDGSVIDLATTPNAVAAVSASGTGQAGAEDISSASPAGKSAFAVMLKAASTRTGNAQRPVAAPVGGTGPPGRAAGMAGGGWQDELRKVALDPERHRAAHSGMLVDEQCVLIPDAYPKARCHGLVIARDPELEGPDRLTSAHLGLLDHMQAVAERWAASQAVALPGLAPAPAAPVALGFHTIPSMRQLHLHVISQDFDSPCIKHKKHWNSFTTPFFLPLAAVKAELASKGRLEINRQAAEQLLKGDLRCHRCQATCKNMPALKVHIAACKAPLPP